MITSPSTRQSLETHVRNALSAYATVPDTEWAWFWPQLSERKYARGARLVREGATAPDLWFIVTGLVRLYHASEDGELVVGFDYEDRFVGDYESVVRATPAALSVQALEPLHTVVIPGRILLQAFERHWCWDRFGRRVLEQDGFRRHDKELRFRTLNAEEHYRLLLERGSPLIGRVALRQLASYLRVTPETLSRIRARVRRSPSMEKAPHT